METIRIWYENDLTEERIPKIKEIVNCLNELQWRESLAILDCVKSFIISKTTDNYDIDRFIKECLKDNKKD